MTIALLVVREASRRRLLLALTLLTLVLAIFTGWGLHRIQDVASCGSFGVTAKCSRAELTTGFATILILLMFMFSWILALAAAFVTAPAIATEVESGVMLAILPRPVRRVEVIAGKWLGLSLLVLLYTGIAMGLEYEIVRIATGYVPPHPLLALSLVVAEGVAVVSLTLLASTRIPAMTCGISVVILFGLMWMGGIAGTAGVFFSNRGLENAGTVSSLLFPTDGLWRAALYNLEPGALIALNGTSQRAVLNPFAVQTAPTTAYLIWALAWIVAILALAMWSFQRREL